MNQRTRLLVVLGSYVVYMAVFKLVYDLAGSATGILATGPVIAVAVLYGLRAGLISGLMTLPLNYVLYQWMVDSQPTNLGSRLLGTGFAIVIAAVIGSGKSLIDQIRAQSQQLTQQRRALEEQVVQREQTERVLQTANEDLEIKFDERAAKLKETNIQLQLELEERKKAEEEIQRYVARLQALRQMTAEIAEELDLNSVLLSISKRAVELMGGVTGSFYLYRPECNVLERVAVASQFPTVSALTRKRGEGLIGKVWDSGKPMFVNDYNRWEQRNASYDRETSRNVMAVPIYWGKEFLGVESIISDLSRLFTDADVDLMSLFVTQASIAIHNAQLFQAAQQEIAERKRAEEQKQQYVEQLEALRQMGLEIAGELDLPLVLRSISERASKLLGGVTGSFYLYSPEQDILERVAVMGPYLVNSAATRQRGEGLIGKVWQNGKPLFVNDYQGWDMRNTTYDDEPTRNVLGVPIYWGTQFLGVETIVTELAHPFTNADVQLMSLFAMQASIAIHNAQLFLAAQQEIAERKRAEELALIKNRQLGTLNQLGQSLNKLATPTEIAERISQMVGQVFDNRNLYIAFYDPITSYISFPIYMMAGEAANSDIGRPFGSGLTEFVIRTQAPLFIPDHMEDALVERGIALIGRLSCCYMAVPMLINDQVLGVIAVQDYEQERVYDASHLELLSTIASQAAIALENARLYTTAQQELNERKRAEEQLLHDAFHDALTGLPNRALFVDRLGHAIERIKRAPSNLFGVLYLDFDRFKNVNDSLGHASGDQLLVEAAQRLSLCVRSLDTVARLGGDEFVILIEDATDASEITQVAERIHVNLAGGFNLQGNHIFTSASIGIVLGSTQYDRPEEVLRDADIAMYRAKARGKARYEIFEPTMLDRAKARLELETDLQTALEHHELQLHYQPILSLDTNKILAFEALLRWRHPRRDFVPPSEFIPIAEETGLILPIGEWVLRTACRQVHEWQLRFSSDVPLAINVNISAAQFSQPGFVDKVTTVLKEAEISPRTLRLELTESILLDNDMAVVSKLEQLRKLGVAVQIDDFGTGYSSLSYLQRLPVDTFKIDRSFINRMGVNGKGTEFVRTMLALAHDLGLKVVAEGVETENQLRKLRDLGCEFGQGYLFCKPVDKDAAFSLLTDSAGTGRNLLWKKAIGA